MRRPPVAVVLLLLLSCRRENTQEPAVETQREKTAGVVVDEGCPHMVDGKCSHSAEAPATPTAKDGPQLYGKALGPSPEVSLSKILDEPSSFHEKYVTVRGHVSRACSRKGCWMELAVDDQSGSGRCRVTFQDYSFFVPTDAAGSRAKLEGRVEVTEVKPAAVRHYESEGASFHQKSADGSAKEVRIVATGVELERI